MYTCPNQHQSKSPDFCSVCGMEISPPPPLPSPIAEAPATPAAPVDPCPDCGAVRESLSQVFCEVCGRNFQTGKAGKVPEILPPVPEAEIISAPVVPAPARWDVTVSVDADLYGTANPDAPVGQPPQVFTLFDEENLIGRTAVGIRLQIPVHHDPGVSRRQAVIIRKRDGQLIIRDSGSANGTQLNGKDLVAGVETPLKDGDVIAMGAWTRIVVVAVM